MIREEMKVGPKGQVVIPKVFRKSAGIHPGTRVIFSLKKEGILIEKPITDTVEIFAKIAKMKKSGKINPHKAYGMEIEERFRKLRK